MQLVTLPLQGLAAAIIVRGLLADGWQVSGTAMNVCQVYRQVACCVAAWTSRHHNESHDEHSIMMVMQFSGSQPAGMALRPPSAL